MNLTSPIPNAYWVIPGRLLAGEYPGAVDDAAAQRKLAALLDAGVTLFVDLTEAGEYDLRPYAPMAEGLAATRGRLIEHCRLSIPDLGTPSEIAMQQILDTIDRGLADGKKIYVHCFAGIGRTGTVIGCHLVRKGLSGQASLEQIAILRQPLPHGHWRSPETDAQRNMVLQWQEG
jgi:hypothetical protein